MIGASSVAQLEQNVDALDNLELSDDELAEIDSHLADEAGVDMWAEARVGEWCELGYAPGARATPEHPGGDRVEPRTRREPETPATLHPKAGRFDRCDGVAVGPATAHQRATRSGPRPLPAGETDPARPHVLVEAQLAAGAQDAAELGERLTRVGNRAEHPADDHRVDRPGPRSSSAAVPGMTRTEMRASAAARSAWPRRYGSGSTAISSSTLAG